MKKLLLLIVAFILFPGCLQSLTIGIVNRIEIADNDTVTTGDVSDTSLDVGPLP